MYGLTCTRRTNHLRYRRTMARCPLFALTIRAPCSQPRVTKARSSACTLLRQGSPCRRSGADQSVQKSTPFASTWRASASPAAATTAPSTSSKFNWTPLAAWNYLMMKMRLQPAKANLTSNSNKAHSPTTTGPKTRNQNLTSWKELVITSGVSGASPDSKCLIQIIAVFKHAHSTKTART